MIKEIIRLSGKNGKNRLQPLLAIVMMPLVLSEVNARRRDKGARIAFVGQGEPMARAVADPKNSQSTATESPATTDDMLSQLAGSEIDRLLAEADEGKNNPAEDAEEAEEKVIAAETVKDESTLDSELDKLFNELNLDKEVAKGESKNAQPEPAFEKKPRSAPAEAPVATAADKASLTNQLDELYSALNVDIQAGTPAPAAAAPSPATLTNQLDDLFNELNKEAKPESAAPAAPPAEIPPPIAATQPEEKAALLEAAGFETTPAPAPAPADERAAVLSAAGFESDEDADLYEDEHIPVYIKILEWVNSPLRYTSDAARQAMGRAAIVTLVNSMLVIGYVLIFRKH
jgi:hypothetical protein